LLYHGLELSEVYWNSELNDPVFVRWNKPNDSLREVERSLTANKDKVASFHVPPKVGKKQNELSSELVSNILGEEDQKLALKRELFFVIWMEFWREIFIVVTFLSFPAS
jgi:hypothetical protein